MQATERRRAVNVGAAMERTRGDVRNGWATGRRGGERGRVSERRGGEACAMGGQGERGREGVSAGRGDRQGMRAMRARRWGEATGREG